MPHIIDILSSKTATWFCILIAILTRVINVLFVSYTGRDKMFLVLQSKSLLSGKGLSTPLYYTHNLETPVYDFAPLWPPGYPILLAPFLKIFNYDIYWASTSLDILACIGLIFIVRKICRQIGLPPSAVNIMTLITGCFEYTFINESLPTDTISLVLFLAGLSLAIRLIVLDHFSVKTVCFTALFLFLPCLFRYNYPAITLAVVAFIMIIGFKNKDALLKKKGVALFTITTLLVAIFFILMKLATGHAGYAAPTERGFYPENIVHWFPFVPASFINLAFLTSQGIRFTGLTFETLMLVLEVINVLCILLLAMVFIRLFRSYQFLKNRDAHNWFLSLGFVACVFLVGVLGYTSLTYAVQKGFLHDWNYVYEPRYFAFVNIFLQLAFIGWLFLYPGPKNLLSKIIAWSFSILLFIEISHNIYFQSKVAFSFTQYKSAVYREQDYSYYISLMKDIKSKYPDHEIWGAAPGDNFYQYLATYYGYKGIADANTFKYGTLPVKKKTILALMLYDHELALFDDLLKNVTILQTEKRANSNFYLIELKP